MRPMSVTNAKSRFGELHPGTGRWSLKQSTVLLYYRKPGELAHSWAGCLVEHRSDGVSGRTSLLWLWP